MVRRFDSAELQKPQYLPNGWVKADAFIARSGLLEYTRVDGSKWIEYRPDSEHSGDTLGSFDAVPLTHEHPKAGLLDAENTKLYQVGTVLSPRVDGERIRAHLLVTDADTVKAIKAGKAELSCGYTCDVDETPGVTPDGKRYDAVQRNVRGNHVAVVSDGRAGPQIRLRIDSRDAEVISCGPVDAVARKAPMHKIKLDGVEYEVSETAAQAVTKTLSAHVETVADLQKKLDTEKARADVASGEVTKLKAEVAAAPEKVRAQIAARLELENKARGVLGETVKFDGKNDVEVMREVAASTGVKLDGKSDAYVEAAFEIALQESAQKDAGKKAAEGTSNVRRDGNINETPTEKIAREYREFVSNAHRAHLSKEK